MSQEAELIRRGAECVTGDLILRNQVVGLYRNGQFILTPEGQSELDVVDVVAAEVPAESAPAAAPAKKPTARRAKPAAAPAEPTAPAGDDADDVLAGVDDLIGE